MSTSTNGETKPNTAFSFQVGPFWVITVRVPPSIMIPGYQWVICFLSQQH